MTGASDIQTATQPRTYVKFKRETTSPKTGFSEGSQANLPQTRLFASVAGGARVCPLLGIPRQAAICATAPHHGRRSGEESTKEVLSAAWTRIITKPRCRGHIESTP